MTNEDILKLSELAKIEVKEGEIESLKKDFESILEYINQIESVSIGDVNPAFSTQNVAREDVVKNSPEMYREDILNSAPNTENGFIKVKKIL
jgi:aspartyl-tRNA(Asn)/glutamyl-tRNA(Gln) amidotransferase subunit C